MPVRSDRLFGPVVVPAASNTLVIVVPATETWLVKRLVVENPSAVAIATIAWRVNAAGGVPGCRVRLRNIPAADVDDYETWLALDPGSQLVITTVALPVNAVGFGAKLLGVAP